MVEDQGWGQQGPTVLRHFFLCHHQCWGRGADGQGGALRRGGARGPQWAGPRAEHRQVWRGWDQGGAPEAGTAWAAREKLWGCEP